MQCPVCQMSQARVTRNAAVADRLDVECLACLRFSIDGPEGAALNFLSPTDREALSTQLRAACQARLPVLLTRGISRTIIEQGWKAAK